MMRTILITIFAFAMKLASAQNASFQQFVVKYDGLKAIPGRVVYKDPAFGKKYLLVDSLKINAEDVKFFQNEKGFYANISRVSDFGEVAFSSAFRTGRINFFYRTYTYISPQSSMSNTKYYYNKGFEDLKRPNYANLSADMKDNEESMFYLNRYKTKRKTTTTLCIIGGSALATALGMLPSSVKKGEKPIPSIIAGGIGITLFWTAAGIKNAGLRNIEKAVDEYNK